MKESAERYAYIIEYLTSYKHKIKLLNKNGYFDAATFYELLASEICALWYGQSFSNLNFEKENYPYVDLLSQDGKIFIQVTTIQDIPSKIKNTLTKIKNSKDSKVAGVDHLSFFVLDNESLKKVCDYSGEKQIGNIEFIASRDLITLERISHKAKTDLDFQLELYNLLQKETQDFSCLSTQFDEAINTSKRKISISIDYKIFGEYEIDRTELINQIKREDQHFISIQGEAGSGKSALCKKLLENEELVLYARAESFVNEKSINQIWDINIENALKFLNGKKVFFFIDALEFIADSRNGKLEMLQILYEVAKQYNNVYIVTSCRSYDYSAFLKLTSIYNISKYTLQNITNDELISISNHYPIISQMMKIKSYSSLLRTPFYINMIVSQIVSLKDVHDESDLRKIIWKKVICLEDQKLPFNLGSSEIRNAINNIVFMRAKEFAVGVSEDIIDKEIISVLLSNNVIDRSEEKVRLKYDIYEDIFFEQFFDEAFERCKGNYTSFYEEVNSLGNCAYRRYQIWVEDKLFAQNNREKFLYKIILTNQINNFWKQQTIIGIVKSRFCDAFFEEYKNMINNNMLGEFIHAINMFSFEASILHLEYSLDFTMLTPIGRGRCCVIQLLKQDEKYKNPLYQSDIIKMCIDYANSNVFDQETAVSACSILEYNIENEFAIGKKGQNHYGLGEKINTFLQPIYKMAEYAVDWIRDFWKRVIDLFSCGNTYLHRFAEEIIVFVLKESPLSLVQNLGPEICDIANHYWIYPFGKEEKTDGFPIRSIDYNTKELGLNENAARYYSEYRSPDENHFFRTMLKCHPRLALDWAIFLTNHVASHINKENPPNVYETVIWFNEENIERKYIGSPDFWLIGVEEKQSLSLIGDVTYLLKNYILETLSDFEKDKQVNQEIADFIRQHLYTKSNNVMMLTIIESIGFQYGNELPGYAIDLASNVDLLLWDLQRFALLYPDPIRNRLEQQIYRIMGVPNLEKRYKALGKLHTLQEYILYMQIKGGDTIKEHIYHILDRFYSQIPNDKDHAEQLLQIQKMDLRNAKEEQINEKLVSLSPRLTGEVEKFYQDHVDSSNHAEKQEVAQIMNDYSHAIVNEKTGASLCLKCIEQLITVMENSAMPFAYQKELIVMIAGTFTKIDLEKDQRSELCDIWIDGIDSIIHNQSFMFDIPLVQVLFMQLDNDLNLETVNHLKKLMLDCLLYKEGNGIVNDIKKWVKKYLRQNSNMAKSLFYTIEALSQDEKNHYRFDLAYQGITESELGKEKHPPEKQQFVSWTDYLIEEKGAAKYESQKDIIIDKHLYKNLPFTIENFNIDDFDIDTLCYISGCGLKLNMPDFYAVMKALITKMIDQWASPMLQNVDIYSRLEVSEFLQEEFANSEDIGLGIKLLFDGIDFTKFKRETFEFYDTIMSKIHTIYFDAHNNPPVRLRCMRNIIKIGEALDNINNENARKRLSSIMFLSMKSFQYIDGNRFPAKYTYQDKQFLNSIWGKYGPDHLEELLHVVYHMHIKELLPEVLVPVSHCFSEAATTPKQLINIIKERYTDITLNEFITKAYLDFNDQIKQDYELTEAYEKLLGTLIEAGYKEAAVLLDDFKIH